MPASRHSAARVEPRRRAAGRASEAPRSPAPARPMARAPAPTGRRRSARRANTKHSLSEFEARRLAPCRPVQRTRRRHRAREGGAGVQVGDDPAHRVVGRGRDRDQLARGVQAGLAQRGDHVGEVGGVDRAHVQAHRSLAGLLEAGLDRAGDLVAGASSSTNRSPEASWRVAPSPRIASVTRKPSRPGQADDGGGVELEQLEVRQRGAGGVGEQQADSPASRAGWWCAPTAPRRRRCRARPRARR